MPYTITAADTESRIIAGRIVSWNAEGSTSAGRTMFKEDSITMAKNIKLVLQHDVTRPLGKMVSFEQDATGITAEFRIAKTTAGNDALEEAATGLRSDFSVGVDVAEWDNKDGVMAISSSNLVEVSLVTDGAIPGAEVEKVAAVENEVSEPTQEETQSTTEGEQVSDTTVPEVAPAAETVEADKENKVEASRPAFYTAPRIELTKRSYLENTLKANLFGDDESRQWLKAADNDQTSGAGFIPTPQSTQLLNFLSNADRPVIDSISRGTMPEFGKTFELPKITSVPLVDQIDENDAVTESQLEASFITVTKKSFKGRAITTLELLTNSTPAFLDELLVQMEFAYAKDTETYVTEEVANDGTLNATGRDNDSDGLLGYISSAAAAVYSASLGFARNLVVTPEQWANIMSYNDNGRPIYIAANPQNAGGALSPLSVRGNVAGLDLRVSRYITSSAPAGTGDYSMVVINPDAYTWYEGARQQLRTNINSDGTVDILLFGQGALATKLGAGANWFNLS